MKYVPLLVLLVSSAVSVRSIATELFPTPLIQSPGQSETGPYFNAAGRFTRYGTLQNDGREIKDRPDQRLNSSVTQVTLGYNFTRTFGVNLEAPFIYRDYSRLNRFEVEDGNTAGVGDISLFANWTAIQIGEGEKYFGLRFSGGVKLPTGDSDRLKEETIEPADVTSRVMTVPPTRSLEPVFVTRVRFSAPGVPILQSVFIGNREVIEPAKFEDITKPGTRDVIRGKDLALGSGSVDGILAANLFTRWQRIFLSADARYTYRTEGEFDYRYADTFQWTGGPGIYVTDGPVASVALQLVCSGEVKGEDEFQGRDRDDTALTAVFLGPSITASWKNRFSAQIGAELPVHVDNSGLQVVPDFRLQASLSWNF